MITDREADDLNFWPQRGAKIVWLPVLNLPRAYRRLEGFTRYRILVPFCGKKMAWVLVRKPPGIFTGGNGGNRERILHSLCCLLFKGRRFCSVPFVPSVDNRPAWIVALDVARVASRPRSPRRFPGCRTASRRESRACSCCRTCDARFSVSPVGRPFARAYGRSRTCAAQHGKRLWLTLPGWRSKLCPEEMPVSHRLGEG
jgi:hypothetical protein